MLELPAKQGGTVPPPTNPVHIDNNSAQKLQIDILTGIALTLLL